MLRRSKGFFLLELLLSLSAILMLSLFLLPLLIELRDQSRQLELEKNARQIMFEELQSKVNSNGTFSNYSSIQNGVEYKISWKNTGLYDKKEVCVRIDKNSFLPEIEICGVLE
jgi:competence protein ComGE